MTEEVVTTAMHRAPKPAKTFRLGVLAPLAVFLVIGVFLGFGLTLDPRKIPSPLIGKAVPEFELPPVKGRTLGLAAADLKGEVSLVNVFASWCTACRDEHPLWLQVQKSGLVPIHGLDYKHIGPITAKSLNETLLPLVRRLQQ